MAQSSPPRRRGSGLVMPGGAFVSLEPKSKRQCFEKSVMSSPPQRLNSSLNPSPVPLQSRSPKRSLRVFQPRINEATSSIPPPSYYQNPPASYFSPPDSMSSPPLGIHHARPVGRPPSSRPPNQRNPMAQRQPNPFSVNQSERQPSVASISDRNWRNSSSACPEGSKKAAIFASEVYSYGNPNKRHDSKFSSTYLTAAGFCYPFFENNKSRIQCLAPILWPTGEYIPCDKVMHNAGYLRHLRTDHAMMTVQLQSGANLDQESAKLFAGPPIWPRVGVNLDQEMTKIGCVSQAGQRGYTCQMTVITDTNEKPCRFCTGDDWRKMKKHFETDHEEAARQWGLVREKPETLHAPLPGLRRSDSTIQQEQRAQRLPSGGRQSMGTSISPAKSTSLVPNSSASPEATRLMPPPPPREPLFPILLDDDEEEEEDPEDRWLPEDEFLNLNPDSLPLPEFIDPGMLSLDNPEVEKPATARPPATASVELVTTWLESNPSLFDSIISYNPGPTPPLTPGTTPTPSFSSIQLGSSSHQQQQQSGLTQPTSTQCGDPQLDRLITAKLLTASVSRQLGNYTESTSGPRPAPHQQSPDAFTCLTLLPTLTLGSDNTLHITTLTECSKPLQSPAQVLSHFIVSHPKVADKYGIRPQWNGVSELLKRGVVGMTGRWFGCKVVCAEGGEGSRDEDGVEQRDGRVCGRRGMGLGELERHLCLEHEGLARRFGVGAFEGCQDDVGLI